MKVISILLTFLFVNKSFCQYGISEDGKYVYYANKKTTIIQTIDGKWKLVVPEAHSQKLINNSKQFIYISHDTLFVFGLKSKKTLSIKDIRSCVEIGYPWFACRKKSSAGDLLFLNVSTGKQYSIKNIREYKQIRNNRIFLTQTDGTNLRLLCMMLSNKYLIEVWEGAATNLSEVVFSPDGYGVGIITTNNDSSTSISHWNEDKGLKLLVKDGNDNIGKGLHIYHRKGKRLLGFNRTGSHLLFYQEDDEVPLSRIYKNETQVWSYLDEKIYPFQEWDAQFKRCYATVVDVQTCRITRLEYGNELLQTNSLDLLGFDGFAKANQDVLVYQFKGDILSTAGMGIGGFLTSELSMYSFNEFNWNSATQFDVQIISLSNGETQKIAEKQKIYDRGGPQGYYFSPSGKFLVMYNFDENDFYLRDIVTGYTKNLTKEINTEWTSIPDGYVLGQQLNPFIRWLPGETGIVVRDGYGDEWLIEFANLKNYKCLTGRNARDKKLRLNLPVSYDGYIDLKREEYYTLINDDRIANPALVHYTGGSKPKLKVIIAPDGPYSYSFLKASDAKVFIGEKSNMNEPKEIVLTTDFANFQVLVAKDTLLYKTAVKKEIIRWTTYTGKEGRGFLYKPADFDSSKKYPVIVNYYDGTMGNRIFESTDKAHFGNFLNQGYLVFLPEIKRSIGEVPYSTYDFVVSGAEHIAKLPFINGKKMGITGSSYGGYQTNYLVTRTNLFAAAVSYVGVSNMISDYGTINYSHRAPAATDEAGQLSTGVTPWHRPDIYIRNSPIFYANRVETPLILSSSIDMNVPMNQSIEFFIALRRLGKKVWFFTDNVLSHSGPSTMKQNNVNLINQFFDHYLKDSPAPRWMIEGIPAKLRGIEPRTELMTNGETPGPGLLMERKPFFEAHRKLLANPTKVNEEGRIENATNQEKP